MATLELWVVGLKEEHTITLPKGTMGEAMGSGNPKIRGGEKESAQERKCSAKASALATSTLSRFEVSQGSDNGYPLYGIIYCC